MNIIDRGGFGKFEGNPLVIGVTSANEYYPIYTLNNDPGYINNPGYTNNREELINGIYIYQKPVNRIGTKRYGAFSNYSDLFRCLQHGFKESRFNFKYADENHLLNCMKGYLADDEDNILMVLATRSDNIYLREHDLFSSELNVEEIRLYVSTRLLMEEKYKNVYKKLEKDYIRSCYDHHIEVMFTTSEKIEEMVFSNHFHVDFDSITELNDHLNSDVAEELLFFDIPVPEHEEEDFPF